MLSRFYGAALMGKEIMILFLSVAMPAVAAVSAAVKAGSGGKVLRGGVFLPGVEGKLIAGDSNEGVKGYFFEFSSRVNVEEGGLTKGRLVQVLPTNTLENMLDEMEKGNVVRFYLWSRVTQYKRKNYLFPTYYLPIEKKVAEEVAGKETPVNNKGVEHKAEKGQTGEVIEQGLRRASVNEANDILSIPQEVLKKMEEVGGEDGAEPNEVLEQQEQSKIRPETEKVRKVEIEVGKRPKYRRNPLLVDRIGYIVKADDKPCGEVGNYKFVPNAFGQGVSKESFILLPCQTMEEAERGLWASPDEVRYEVAGIVASFRGQKYLLLHRAVQVRSYGNFIR